MDEIRTQYLDIFCRTFEISHAEIALNPSYQSIPSWDSIGHMALMAALEDHFSIELDIDDIIEFSSFERGFAILGKYVGSR